MKMEQTHVFPAQKANQLDSKLRSFFQNPYKNLTPYVLKGMTVLDYGCGNGYSQYRVVNLSFIIILP